MGLFPILFSPSRVTTALAFLIFAASGCATTDSSAPKETTASKDASAAGSDELPAQVERLRESLTAMTAKVQDLEDKLASVGEKANFAREGMDQLLRKGDRATPVSVHPSSARGASPDTPDHRGGPIMSFSRDPAVQAYRDALIGFEAGQFSDSILAFSGFLKRFPDHALAGSAQHFIGAAYLKNREYKLAREELSRSLSAYPRGRHVADSLALLSEADEHLQDRDGAERSRQSLLSLFPQSPAARSVVTSPVGRKEKPALTEAKAAPAENFAPEPLGSGIDAPPITAPLNTLPEESTEDAPPAHPET
ncbi:MAG: hypothetical protein IT285_08505 [Bdellovibrionales bacterium]|nr:hypothetical protein [Bdellovibrionales bacterium]